MKILHTICFVLLFCGICRPSGASTPDDDTYGTQTRLFHIERSINKNIVCYDLNTGAAGAPDVNAPLSVYWINREEHPGQQGALSYIQQKLAYGYHVVGKQDKGIVIELNAVKNRKITIDRNDGKYICRMDINKQPSVLLKVYVKTKTSNSLQVEYVDIQGYDLASGAPVTERIKP